MSIALLVHAGDNSEWVWPHWYRYWKKNAAGKVKTYFATETKNPNFEGVTCLQVGAGLPWGKTLHLTLNQIPETHVVYFHEDYFNTDPVDSELLEKLHKIVCDHKIVLLKCCGWWMGYDDPQWPAGKSEADGVEIWKYNSESPYLVSHQASIWEKKFLFDSVLPAENPWQHEMIGTGRVRRMHAKIFAWRGPLPIPYRETVNRGKKRPGTEEFFQETP